MTARLLIQARPTQFSSSAATALYIVICHNWSNCKLPVLIVPCGSGNDFANALNQRSPRVSQAAWRKFCSAAGNVRTIDLGVITPLIPDGPGAANPPEPHYFCCVGGVGLDAEIARRANLLPRWLRARGGYALSLLPALWRFEPIPISISLPVSRIRMYSSLVTPDRRS